MIACQVAYTLFHTPTKIARVRARNTYKYSKLFARKPCRSMFSISPEQLVTDYIQRLIEHPGALQVLDFAGGRIQLVAVARSMAVPLVGHELRDLHEHMPGVDARVAAIFRRAKPSCPRAIPSSRPMTKSSSWPRPSIFAP